MKSNFFHPKCPVIYINVSGKTTDAIQPLSPVLCLEWLLCGMAVNRGQHRVWICELGFQARCALCGNSPGSCVLDRNEPPGIPVSTSKSSIWGVLSMNKHLPASSVLSVVPLSDGMCPQCDHLVATWAIKTETTKAREGLNVDGVRNTNSPDHASSNSGAEIQTIQLDVETKFSPSKPYNELF